MKNKKILGGFMVACSSFMLVVSLAFGGPKVNILTGIILFIVGIIYLTKSEPEKKE